MTTKTTQIPFDNFIASLIKNGYSDEVRAFTKSIETKPRMVQDFADSFNRLIGLAGAFEQKLTVSPSAACL